MHDDEKEFLKSLKIPKNDILADNYEERVEQYLTTKNLYNFFMGRLGSLYAIDRHFVANMLCRGALPIEAGPNTIMAEARFESLKSTLNVAKITNVDKAFDYACTYYTTTKYDHCCKNTDDLYNLVTSMHKQLDLEGYVIHSFLKKRSIPKNDPKLECFIFYRNYISNNVIDMPLKDSGSIYYAFRLYHSECLKALQELRQEVQAKEATSAARKQMKTVDLNMIADSLTDMSVAKLKTTYPFCAIVRHSYSSGWAQDSTKVTTHYHFTNLAKGEIKSLLKNNGVNVKTEEKDYDNGYSNDYEHGGTAKAHEYNSFEYVVSSSIKDFKIGREYKHNSYIPGIVYDNYVHIMAKPNDAKKYQLKARPGRLFIPKHQTTIQEVSIDGKVNTVLDRTVGFDYYESNDEHKPSKSCSFDDAIELIRSGDANKVLIYLVSGYGCNCYIKDTITGAIKYIDRYSPLPFEFTTYLPTGTVIDRYGIYGNFTVESFTDFVDTFDKGIPVTIPSNGDKYILYKQEGNKVYLMKDTVIIHERTSNICIDKAVFDAVFEEID